MKRPLHVSGWVALLLACSWHGGRADEPASVPLLDLVHQLGSPEFVVREAAERSLMQRGASARPALLRGLQDADLEVRLASQRILICSAQCEFEALADAFLDGDKGVSLDRFPGWSRLREQLGDTKEVRQFYVNMLRAEPDLLRALERQDGKLADEWLKQMQTQVALVSLDAPDIRLVSGPSLNALIFVGVEIAEKEQDPAGRQTLGQLSQFLLTRLDDQLVARLGLREPIARQLLAVWAETLARGDHNGAQHTQALQLALKFELPDLGCKLARAVFEKRMEDPNVKPYAAITLGRFGAADDANYLIPHLQDARVFHTWSNPQLQKEPIQIQVRDVMLAVLLRMRGHDPATCGFDLLEPFPETLYRIWTFGFLQEAQRSAAFERWQPVAVADPPAKEEAMPTAIPPSGR